MARIDHLGSIYRAACEVKRAAWPRSSRGEARRSHALNVIVQRVGAKLGLRKVHPHGFRHTFATWAARACCEREVDVQAPLGRASTAIVRRYSRTGSPEQVVVAHGAFSPMAQRRPQDFSLTPRRRAAR